jgi:chaperonin GroEL
VNVDNEDQKVGITIVEKALQTPARQIFTNAGEDGPVIVGQDPRERTLDQRPVDP